MLICTENIDEEYGDAVFLERYRIPTVNAGDPYTALFKDLMTENGDLTNISLKISKNNYR